MTYEMMSLPLWWLEADDEFDGDWNEEDEEEKRGDDDVDDESGDVGVAGTSGEEVAFSLAYTPDVSIYNWLRCWSCFLRHDFFGIKFLNMSSSSSSVVPLVLIIDDDSVDPSDHDNEVFRVGVVGSSVRDDVSARVDDDAELLNPLSLLLLPSPIEIFDDTLGITQI